MISKGVNKIGLMAAAGLLTFALASAPANAHHDGPNYIAPLAAFIALNAFIHHNHHGHSHRRHYGHHRPHYRKHHRKHSHSHGGYHAPRHRRHNHW